MTTGHKHELTVSEIRTEDRIRDAAVELFSQKGYAATGIREIASRAGVATSVLYHYVPNKEALLVDIMRTGLGNVLQSARRAVAGQSGPWARLAALCVNHMVIEVTRSSRSMVIDNDFRSLTGTARDEVLAARDEYEAIWNEVLRAGVSSGAFSISDLSLTRLFLIDLCNGVKRWYRPDGRFTLEAVCSETLRFAFKAVGATTATQEAEIENRVSVDASFIRDVIIQYGQS
jgi:AcrR family transcriptional regulator